MTTEALLIAALAFIVGAVIAYFFSIGKVKSLKDDKQKEAARILKEASTEARDIVRSA